MKITSSDLTAGYSPELERQIRKTFPGMAHFAGTGPASSTCGDCAFLEYWKQVRNGAGDTVSTGRRRGCAKFLALTGNHGPLVPKRAEACKYFERKDDGK